MIGSETVTRLRGRSRDAWGDLAGEDAETDIAGCSVQPLGGTEDTGAGDLVVTNLTLVCPPGTDITATDRVRWGGSVYAVDGPPEPWADRLGRPSHVQAQLILREGQG